MAALRMGELNGGTMVQSESQPCPPQEMATWQLHARNTNHPFSRKTVASRKELQLQSEYHASGIFRPSVLCGYIAESASLGGWLGGWLSERNQRQAISSPWLPAIQSALKLVCLETTGWAPNPRVAKDFQVHDHSMCRYGFLHTFT